MRTATAEKPVDTGHRRPPARVPKSKRTVKSKELAKLKDRYLVWLIATNYSQNTVNHAHNQLQSLFFFLEARGITRIADVTTEILEIYSIALRRLKNGLPPRPVYIHHRLNMIKQFFKWLLSQSVILKDPAEDLEMPKLPSQLPHTILTQAEARRLLDAPDLRSPIGYRDKALLELLYASGVRSRELLRLKIEDVDIKNRLVYVWQGKGAKDRVVPIPEIAASFVLEYVTQVRSRFAKLSKPDDGTLFLNWNGHKLNLNRLCEIMRKNVKLAKIEKRVTAITLRHSLASALLENGMGIRYIQKILGHDKVSSTEIYSKVTLTGLKAHHAKHFMKERRNAPRRNDFRK